MLGVRVDTVFHEAFDRAKTLLWGRCAAWLSKPGAVPRMREDLQPALAQRCHFVATPRHAAGAWGRRARRFRDAR